MDTSKAEAGARDAAPEPGRRAAAQLKFLDHAQGEREAIRGASVGEPLLGELPHALVGIEFWRVGGQELKAQPPHAAAQPAHQLPAVKAEAIPDQEHRAAQVAEQMAQEGNDFEFAEVVVVPLVVEAEAATARADRDPGDHRDPVVALGMAQPRRLAARRPGARHGGREHEARFIYEDEVGPQPKRPLFTRGQRVRFQCAIAASSRSRARRSGFWQLQSQRASRRPT